MKCPIDTDTDLVMTDRQGIEIDYCPRCRGVWLDRGELDKIIERSAAPSAPVGANGLPLPADDRRMNDDRRDDRRGDRYDDDSDEIRRPVAYDRHGRPKKKRGSIFEELFDF